MRDDPDFETYQRIFASNYSKQNYDHSLAGLVMREGHRKSEISFNSDQKFERVLELGAGNGSHLHYVRHKFSEYRMTDDNEIMLELLKRTAEKDSRANEIIVEKQNALKPAYSDESFDRLIATHLLEHLPEPHLVLRNWYRLLKPAGVMTLLLPCDPGIAWRIGRMLGPRKKAVEAGIDYDYWMAREHINPIGNLIALIRYYFDDHWEAWSPLALPSWNVNFFYICHIRKPKEKHA